MKIVKNHKIKRFYIDTSIWIDFFEDRKDNLKPLGEFAFQFLKKCKKYKCKIIFSEPLIFELKKFSEQWLNEIFSSFKELLAIVSISENQRSEAEQIAKKRGLPFNDIFHAIIARDNNAIIISRDKHFEELSDLVECFAPEEVIFD